MISNPDFKVAPLFDVEHLRNDTRYLVRGYYRPQIESGLCHCQWLWSTFKVI